MSKRKTETGKPEAAPVDGLAPHETKDLLANAGLPGDLPLGDAPDAVVSDAKTPEELAQVDVLPPGDAPPDESLAAADRAAAVLKISAFFYQPAARVEQWLADGCPYGPMDAINEWRKRNVPLAAVRILDVSLPLSLDLEPVENYQHQRRQNIDVSCTPSQHLALRYLLAGLEKMEMVGPASPQSPKNRNRVATQGDALRWLLDQIFAHLADSVEAPPAEGAEARPAG